MKNPIIIFGFFFALFAGYSSALDTEAGFWQNITPDLDQVAASHRWHRILNYVDGELEIKEQSLYLTDIKSFSPKEELVATITEYLNFSNHSSSIICSSPSRAILITHLIQELPTFDPKKCAKFYKWAQQGSVRSISLLYVTGYLQNPASFYGHTLIKFNTEDGYSSSNNLFDSTLNYGANFGDDAALPYVLKGLTGLYDASLSEERFFRFSALYQEFQMRDIYEYKLRLSKFQRELIISYSYEMLKNKFKYYFLSDNCAFRMNLILGLALDEDPIPNLPWSAPIDVLMGVNKRAIVEDVIYHPSQSSRTKETLTGLSSSELKSFHDFRIKKNYSELTNEHSTQLKIALLEHLNFLKLKYFKSNKRDKLVSIDHYRKFVLLSLSKSSEDRRKQSNTFHKPHEINDPTLLRYSAKKIQGGGIAHKLQLRGANFELLDRDETRSRNSEFVLLSPSISVFDGKTFIDEFIFLKVLNLNDADIYIPGEKTFSWGVEVARKSLSEKCYPCATGFASGAIGKAFYLSEALTAYFLFNISAHGSKFDSGNFSGSVESGFVLRPHEKFKLHVGFESTKYKSASVFDENAFLVNAKLNLSSENDFEIKLKKTSDYSSFQIDFNLYF